LINAFISIVTLQDITLTNITLSEISIKAVVSTITFENVIITNLSNPVQTDFMLIMIESTVIINNMNYSSSDSTLFKAITSSIEIMNIGFSQISNVTELVSISNCYNVSMNTITSTDSLITGNDLFIISNSDNVTLTNIDIQNSHNAALRIFSSNITRIYKLNLNNCTKGLIIESSTVLLLEDSTFMNNGGTNLIQGGGLYMINSDISISNSSFKNNIAQSGAALYFSCSSISLCSLNLNTTHFELNNAIEKGGAIYYDFLKPVFGSGITYSNNTAQYGPDIASYAVKITLSNDISPNIRINHLGSGIVYEKTLKLVIRDYDNQIMIMDSQNKIILTAVNSTIAKIKGFSSVGLQKGIAEFNNFIVEAEPGIKNIKVAASSLAIDQAKITSIFGSQISENTLEVDLRYCKPGEQIIGKTCFKCPSGTYSFDWNSTQCHQCIDNVICEGGAVINVNPGYWRASTNSTNIIECINKNACQGGYYDSSSNPTK